MANYDKGQSKYKKYAKRGEADKWDIMEYQQTQKERGREGRRSPSGAPEKLSKAKIEALRKIFNQGK